MRSERFILICSDSTIGNYVSHRLLAKGAHNENYLVLTDQGEFVFRVGVLSDSLQKEWEFLSATNGQYGPRAYWFDDSGEHDVLIMEYIKGKHPEKWSNELLDSLARFFSKLHKMLGRKGIFSSQKYFETHISSSIKKYQQLMPKSSRSKLQKACESLEKQLGDHSCRVTPVHADVNLQNIFLIKNEILLIDWEFVEENPIELELAYLKYKLHNRNVSINSFLERYEHKYDESLFELCYALVCGGLLLWRIERIAKLRATRVEGFGISDEDELVTQFNERLEEFCGKVTQLTMR